MKAVFVASLLIAVMFAGCSDIEPIVDLSPRDEEDTTPPPTPPEDPGTSWNDIPLVEHQKGEPFRVNATAGVNLLRVNVSDLGAPALTKSNTSVDHITYVYHGHGPFDGTVECKELAKPSAFDYQVGDIEYRTKYQYNTAEQGEHLILIVAGGAFQAIIYFGSGTSGSGDPSYIPLNLGGSLQSASNSTTEKYPRNIEDPFDTQASWFMAAGARATQTMVTDGADIALGAGNDSIGSLTVTMDDGAGCTDEEDNKYQVVASDTGTTEVSVAAGGMRGTGRPVNITSDYDRHDGSEEGTVKWTLAWFELPDVRV